MRLSLALNLLVACAWAQESRAIISGTVTDPQGAAVPAAIVEVKNLETNVASKTVTNDHGLYTLPPLNPGMYSVTVSAVGFKTAIQRSVELRVADRIALDFKLELGGTTETVNVVSEVRSSGDANRPARAPWSARNWWRPSRPAAATFSISRR